MLALEKSPNLNEGKKKKKIHFTIDPLAMFYKRTLIKAMLPKSEEKNSPLGPQLHLA